MIIHDISRDLNGCEVYPGDPETQIRFLKHLDNGDEYTLSVIGTCSHAATHIDAPSHFYADGRTLDQLPLSTFYGKCTVITISGVLTGADMEKLLPYCKNKILLHGQGKAYISSSAAIVLSESNVSLIGTDALSIAPEFDEEKTHLELAKSSIAVLEGLDLEGIEDGEYVLSAFPIRISKVEAAPCRAILFQQEKGF
ncbi:hypothetical protein B5F08_04180 [Anaeromassilibacillus sp. An172]|uniref:cyclase family protein n=1 Tax=Anaeromassilibacillus sp. An172 TaxID=1965570 RepID=UPI000B369518|nr:cyclase family protein [Anaeromassilibacillus sp. An172]OUP79408.1 hypothetical protein B5F08_04180 [Anaeromassilibacillus sp. An172]